MKPFFCLVTSMLMVLTLFAQAEEKKIYSQDFKWSITIPEGFQQISEAEWRKIQNRGAAAIEDTYNEKVTDRPAMVFVFKNNQFNYFEANYQSFDPETDGDYEAMNQASKEIIYGTFEAQMAGAKLDSSSTIELIDGLSFYAFHIEVQLPNGFAMKMAMYNRLFEKKDLTIGMVTTEDEKRKLLLQALKNSIFGK